jgi:excisionase family DNA binding protein
LGGVGNERSIERKEDGLTLSANRTEIRPSEAATKSVEVPPVYLTVTEMAALMRVCKETAYIWCRSGEIPARQVGGTWRIKRSDLEEMFVK